MFDRPTNGSSASKKCLVTDGIASIAVPLSDGSGASQTLAVLSLTGPSVRLSDKTLKGFLNKLQAAAGLAAASLEQVSGIRARASAAPAYSSRDAQPSANR